MRTDGSIQKSFDRTDPQQLTVLIEYSEEVTATIEGHRLLLLFDFACWSIVVEPLLPDIGVSKGAPRLTAGGLIAVTGKVEDGELVAVAGALEHLGMAQCTHGVVVARTPMLLHGQPRELIVFRVTFEASRSIDEMHTLRHPEVLERAGNGDEITIFDFAGDGD